MILVRDVILTLNDVAHVSLQEEYDNAGLITGNPLTAISGILISLDCVESIVDEAVEKKCNLIVCHHPIVFRGLKKLNGNNYVEKTIIKAIKNDIAIYAIHTNLDNVIHGVNRKIADKLGLLNLKILAPKKNTLKKITTFVPTTHLESVVEAMHKAGAGQIGNYKECSFRVPGTGTYIPIENTNPYSGKLYEKSFETEVRVEMILPYYLENNIITAMKLAHPYEEVAYYIQNIDNVNQEIGSGIIGELKEPMNTIEFLSYLKNKMELNLIKHTALIKNKIQKIAICGGSGSFLTQQAINAGADIYISADYKYHEFFDADDKIIIADIGHYESEIFTIELLYDLISNKFNTFAVHLTGLNTNPVLYYK
jgi:dinuclear metal center YbgI/SA1388 family protein